jgi:16S rRNA G1207 methylase RsmC
MDSASHHGELAFTGERFVPNSPDIDSRLRAEHMLRYLASRELVHGRHVLDVGCGEGYGSAMLAETSRPPLVSEK